MFSRVVCSLQKRPPFRSIIQSSKSQTRDLELYTKFEALNQDHQKLRQEYVELNKAHELLKQDLNNRSESYNTDMLLVYFNMITLSYIVWSF